MSSQRLNGNGLKAEDAIRIATATWAQFCKGKRIAQADREDLLAEARRGALTGFRRLDSSRELRTQVNYLASTAWGYMQHWIRRELCGDIALPRAHVEAGAKPYQMIPLDDCEYKVAGKDTDPSDGLVLEDFLATLTPEERKVAWMRLTGHNNAQIMSAMGWKRREVDDLHQSVAHKLQHYLSL